MRLLFVLACVLSGASLLPAQNGKLADATQQIEKRISDSHADVGVVF